MKKDPSKENTSEKNTSKNNAFEKLHRINYLGAEMDALYHRASHKLRQRDARPVHSL